MALSGLERLTRQSIKRLIYSQLALVEASKLVRGDSKPLIRFTIEGTPPSVYFNFRVLPEQRTALEDALCLPHELSLTPIRCRSTEEPFHALTLNVYRVSGLTNGLRAEWSVYVRDRSGKPRYLIVEARSSQPSMDPVDLITRASRVEHALTQTSLTTCIEGEAGTFCARLNLPEADRALPFNTAPEWIEANDFIYWRNGVCDRAFYDGAMANGKMWELDPHAAELSDHSAWSRYIDPKPAHIVMLSGAAELVISPWWNV